MNILHHFSSANGAFIGASEARLDPLDKTPMVPGHSTLSAPPEPGADQIARWDGETWVIVADRRGEEYWLPDGTRHLIDEIGVDLPSGALPAPPPTPAYPDLLSARAAMIGWIDGLAAQVTGTYPAAEVQSWGQQEDAARAFLSDGASAPAQHLALLDAIRQDQDGETRTDRSGSILAKANAYRAILGAIVKLRDQTDTALAAVDPVAPEGYETVLQGALAAGTAMALQMGLATE